MAVLQKAFAQKAKLVAIGLVAGLVLGIGGSLVAVNYNPPDRESTQVDTSLLLNEITQINELATASQTYTVVEKVESTDRLFNLIDNPLSTKWFILTYGGEIKAGVNLDDTVISVEGQTVHVALPAATVLSDAIDTGSFRTLHEQDGLFNPITIDDVTSYIDESRREAEAAAVSGTVLAEAQANAETSVRSLLEASLPDGYTVVFDELADETGEAAE